MAIIKLHKKIDWLKRTSLYAKTDKFFSHYIVGLFHKIDEHHIFLLGGGLAFSLFVCIVPFILIIFSVLGNILEVSSVKDQIISLIDRIIPYTGYASFVKTIISSRMEEVIAHKNLAGYLGVLGLLFAASGLFSSMRTVLNKLYKVSLKESVVIGKLRDFGMILLVILFFLISITILPVLEFAKDSADRIAFLKLLQFSAIPKILFSIFSFLMVFTVFFMLYYSIPIEKIAKKACAVSALSASILWEIAKQLFGYYITNFATLNRIYGAYVLMVVVAFWIYYSSVIFIVCAAIGQLYREAS